MGYTISVPCKSNKARDRVREFITCYAKSFYELMLEDPPELEEYLSLVSGDKKGIFDHAKMLDVTQELLWGARLTYGSGNSRVGFNYNSASRPYALHMYALTRWIAFHAGRRAGSNALSVVGHADQRTRYYLWDHEVIPVLSEEDIEGWSLSAKGYAHQKEWVVDDSGWLAMSSPVQYLVDPYGNAPDSYREYVHTSMRVYELANQISKREIDRITNIWRDACGATQSR